MNEGPRGRGLNQVVAAGARATHQAPFLCMHFQVQRYRNWFIFHLEVMLEMWGQPVICVPVCETRATAMAS